MKDAYRLLPRIPEIYGEPFGDVSAVPTYLLAEATGKVVKVALSGDGGDELFGGYGWYQKFEKLRHLEIPFRSRVREWLRNTLPAGLRGRAFLRRSLMPRLEAYTSLRGGMEGSIKERLFSASWLRQFEDYDDYWFFRKHWQADLDLRTSCNIWIFTPIWPMTSWSRLIELQCAVDWRYGCHFWTEY